MANRKFSAFTNSPTRAATDTLVGLDVSAAAAAQNSYWTLNTLFSEISLNTADGSIRWGGVAAPAVSAAGKGAIYFDSTSNTFKVSQNGGAYFNVGNITTTGFTSTRIPLANGANTLIDDAGLTFNTTTDFLTLGTSGGGGATFVGTNGNTVSLAASAPSAATYLYFLPNAAPSVGQFLYAAAVGAQTTLGWQTAPSGTGSANQVAVWGALNALTGSSALTFTSGVVAISGTTNPGVTITGTAATESGITVNQSVSGAAADAFHSFQTPSTTVVWRLTTAGFTPTGLIKANQLDTLGASGTVEMLWRLADASTRFVYGVNNVEAASINATSTLGLVLGAASTLTGRVRMFNSAGATYTQLSAGNAASSLNFIWPVVNPTSGQVLSASAPSGSDVTLSWASAAAAASLTATQVGFGDGTNMLSGSADFTYATATGVLDVTKTGVNSSVRMTVTNASAGTAAQARFGASSNSTGASLAAYSSTFTTAGLITADSALLDLDAPTAIIAARAAGALIFGMGTTTERARLTDTTFLLSIEPTTGNGLSVAASSVTTGNLVSIVASGTAAASNTKTGLLVATSGANATASQTTYAARFTNTSTGTSATNVALNLSASGATTNRAVNVASGSVNLTAGTNFTLATNNSTILFDVTGDPAQLTRIANLSSPVQPITQANYWREGVTSYTSNTGAITYNPVRWGGWNISSPGAPIETSQPALWYAWEGSYDPSSVSAYPPSPSNGFPWFEPHLLSYIPAGGSEIRLLTATIQPGTTAPPGSANGYVKFDHRATLWDFQNLESDAVLGLQRGSLNLHGATSSTLTLTDAAGLNFSIANTASVTTMTGFNALSITQSGSPSAGQAALSVSSVSNRFNTVLNSTSTGAGYPILTLNNSSAVAGNYASVLYQFGGTSLAGMGALLRSTGPNAVDLYLSTETEFVLWVKANNRVGLRTTTPSRQLEINSDTGDNLRLSYNAPSGSATNYADFQVTSGGNLTITPSGGLANLVGNLVLGAADDAAPVARTLSVQNVVAGTSNTAGANWTFIGSRGTGTGAGGNLIWQVAPAGSTGSSQNALINGLVLTSTGNLYGAALHNNSTSPTGATNQYIASGTYTPTVTAVTNCTATSSGPCNWIRVGNVVTVSGVVAVDPTVAATFTSVGISLPIASNFATNASECAGVAANANFLGYSGAITADFTNDRAQLDFTVGTDVSNQAWSFSLTYVVL